MATGHVIAKATWPWRRRARANVSAGGRERERTCSSVLLGLYQFGLGIVFLKMTHQLPELLQALDGFTSPS